MKPYTKTGKKNIDHPVHAANAKQDSANKAADAKRKADAAARKKVGDAKRAAAEKTKPFTKLGRKKTMKERGR